MRISSYLFPFIRFHTFVGSFFALSASVILMLVLCETGSADKKSTDVKPYGIDQRIPWETSRVVGAPDTTDDFSILARESEQFIEAGKAIFNGKGSCYSCHTLNPSAPLGRGPDLTNIGVGAATRKPGMGAKGYLIESLYDPAAFLVHGYGKTMTPAWRPPISLSNLEIEAVIAFLQSQGGEADLTPFEPPVDIQTVAKEMGARPLIETADAERGRDVFINVVKCIACHDVSGVEKPEDQTLDDGVEIFPGPDLTDIAALNSIGYIEESILKPSAEIVRGYGVASVATGGVVLQGTLISQDSEKIVLQIEGSTEPTERTLLLSEIDPEPIEVLTDLAEQGYFWVQVTPNNSEPIRGDLVREDEDTLTLKVETSPEEIQTVSKSNLKIYVTVTLFDGDSIVGTLVSENEDQIVIESNGVKRTFNKFDIDEGPTYSRAFGKRINVKSPMPDNYAQLLSVDQHYDLLAFLSTLTGKTSGSASGPSISLRPKQTFTKFPLNQPVYIEPEPGTDQLLVIELGGKIRRFKDDPEADSADFLIDTGRETYGLTFHPNYEENGYLYVVSNGPIGGKVTETRNYVSRFTVDRQPPYGCDPNSELIILEWLSNNHNGGDLAFGPDGYLYIPAGDGAMDSDTNLTGLPGSYDRDPKGQDLSNLPATIMRIDVDRPEVNRPYSIPSDNPFIHLEGARPEIWVYGIRNPWRITFDRETGHLWAGNVGQDRWEMIHLVQRGDNYGWSLYEGSHPFFLNRKQGPTPIVKPTVEHPHSEARSITGGVVYYGSKFPELWGAYVYGDYATGKMWALHHDGKQLIWHREIGDTTLQIVSFGVDHNGEILIVDLARGIYQLERKPKSTEKFPTRLSETGMFISVKNHQTDPGLIPYSVNAPLWVSGADVERFIALPGDSQIEMSAADGVGWSFPDGTALIQTFSFDLEAGNPNSKHRIETRMLTRQQGEWVGYSYIWNDEQTDATLVAAAGTDRVYTIQDASAPEGSREQSWHYPSREACMDCHSRAANYVLGLTTLQMNKVHNYGVVSDNQLRTLNRIGIFKKPLSKPPEAYPKLSDPYNPKESLEARARSYLHAACANCHVHTGGGNARIVLDFKTDIDKTYSVGFRPQHDTYGIPDAMLIAPGDPERSILYQRVAHRGEGQMPPLATSQKDEQAVQLLYDWISQMKPTSENQ